VVNYLASSCWIIRPRNRRIDEWINLARRQINR